MPSHRPALILHVSSIYTPLMASSQGPSPPTLPSPLSPASRLLHKTDRGRIINLVALSLSLSAIEMAALLLLVLTGLMFSAADAAWCVCRSDASSTLLQKALDYACGAGADCSQIQQNAACYNPNTVVAHCSFAANSYYQRKGQAQGACDFSGAAALTPTDPGGNGCTYPATPSAAGASSTPTITTPSTSTPTPPTSTTPTGTTVTTPSSLTPPTFAPPTFTPSTGTTGTGGVLGGLGPTGTTGSLDNSGGGLLPWPEVASLLAALLLSSLFLVFRV